MYHNFNPKNTNYFLPIDNLVKTTKYPPIYWLHLNVTEDAVTDKDKIIADTRHIEVINLSIVTHFHMEVYIQETFVLYSNFE